VLIDIVLGIVGAAIDGWVFGRLGGFPFGGMLDTIVMAFAGAVSHQRARASAIRI
jgi:uncharacterized membrane protein YeaQ/YmgE (transglycosylase-associated protein family)